MDTRARILDLIARKFNNRAEFERYAELKPRTVNDWERKSESFYKCIPKLAKILATTSNYLLCETDDPAPSNQLNNTVNLEIPALSLDALEVAKAYETENIEMKNSVRRLLRLPEITTVLAKKVL